MMASQSVKRSSRLIDTLQLPGRCCAENQSSEMMRKICPLHVSQSVLVLSTAVVVQENGMVERIEMLGREIDGAAHQRHSPVPLAGSREKKPHVCRSRTQRIQ